MKEVKLNFRGGGSFVFHQPQFSYDSENVYVVWKNRILGYATKTGKLIAEFKGMKDDIVGFSVHYYDSFECITACSKSGEFITWKIVTYFKIFTKKLEFDGIKTFHLIRSDDEEELLALISLEHKSVEFSLVDIKKASHQSYSLSLDIKPYSVGVGDQYFCVIQDSRLYFVRTNNFSSYNGHNIEKSRFFTCLACHPSEEVVLTGDNTGRVVVWQKLHQRHPAKAVFHWHTLPVKCVSFSESGTYFYSGGDECVLVRWQIDNHHEKNFLPRLPANIEQISVSTGNLHVAIATSDNAIRIVNSRLDQVSLIQNLVIGEQFDSGIVLDPRTKALVMNGNIGHLQFYSPHDGSLLYNVDVVGQNKITNERGCNIQNTQIHQVAMSKNGLWLATVEGRKDLWYSSELRLKFWNFDLENQTFKLNTSIEYPHDALVYSIEFEPSFKNEDLLCITVGDDKKFKIWQLTDASTIYKKRNGWKCLGTGFYRGLQCKALSFSVDGSLMAISFDEILTTWLPGTCELKCSLIHPIYKEKIEHIQFGISNQCHLVVTAGQERLAVWNLLTLSMLWTVPLQTSILIKDVVTTNMAVITKDQKLFVFTPESPKPVYTSLDLLQDQEEILQAVFVPTKYSNDVKLPWHQRSSIFFINSDRELYSIGAGEEEEELGLQFEEAALSAFSIMKPKSHVSAVKPADPTYHAFTKDVTHKAFKNYFEAPLHTMIPIRIMCESLLQSMVIQKEKRNE